MVVSQNGWYSPKLSKLFQWNVEFWMVVWSTTILSLPPHLLVFRLPLLTQGGLPTSCEWSYNPSQWPYRWKKCFTKTQVTMTPCSDLLNHKTWSQVHQFASLSVKSLYVLFFHYTQVKGHHGSNYFNVIIHINSLGCWTLALAWQLRLPWTWKLLCGAVFQMFRTAESELQLVSSDQKLSLMICCLYRGLFQSYPVKKRSFDNG